MRLTRAGEYAVRCILYLCNKGQGTLVSRHEIAERSNIPTLFLAKIAQQLAKKGFIEIRQGARGGFVLTKNPADISLLEVVETMIGEIYLNDCILRPETCEAHETCAVHQVWQEARRQLRATLASASMAELSRGRTCPELTVMPETADPSNEAPPDEPGPPDD